MCIMGIVCFLMVCCFAAVMLIASGGGVEPPIYKMEGEETTMHVDGGSRYRYPAEDVRNLAKIMQAESGIDWPDWAVLCIGEVVLNRVGSPLFPDSIFEVLHQGPPIQYAPVWELGWKELEPKEQYIDLAIRLLDGERVLKNPRVIWQALFPQGERTVLTYYDRALNSTTYFCE